MKAIKEPPPPVPPRDSVESPKEDTPYHFLMSEEAKEANASKRRLDRKLQRDYLSKRQRAFQDTKTTANEAETADDVLWSGASPLERALVACCTSPHSSYESEDEHDDLEVGALVNSKIAHFLGIVALHAHSVCSRALALAILERTQELDDRIYRNYELTRAATMKNSTAVKQETTPPGAEDSPLRKKARLKVEDDDGETAKTNGSASLIVPVKPPPPRRMPQFLSAGGLRLLSRWLVEASTPMEPPTSTTSNNSAAPPRRASSSSNTRANLFPSATGALLLPLLQLLARIPFDKILVTQSKINKNIRDLSKALDAASTTQTDPVVVAGGCWSVSEIQDAVNHVKSVWATAAAAQAKIEENDDEKESDSLNPLHKISRLVQERLTAVEQWKAGVTETRPQWLAAPKAPKKTRSAKHTQHKQSTEQMARREREHERAALMKQDLEEARRERQELLRKLRDIKKIKAAEQEQVLAQPSRRRVQWKDGIGPASKLRKRELLEEVRIYIKDQDRSESSGDDEESQSLQDDVKVEGDDLLVDQEEEIL